MICPAIDHENGTHTGFPTSPQPKAETMTITPLEKWYIEAEKAADSDLNDKRAARVLQAIMPAYDDFDLQAALGDVLADLRHLCDLMGYDFEEHSQRGRRHYMAELGENNGCAANDSLRAAIERDLT